VPGLQAARTASSWLGWRSVWPCNRALGYTVGAYGAGMSVYSHFIARGHEVVFPKNQRWRLGSGGGRRGLLARLPEPFLSHSCPNKGSPLGSRENRLARFRLFHKPRHNAAANLLPANLAAAVFPPFDKHLFVERRAFAR
jgi:hypothetical protein